jgi:acetolactate synthase-1/2/3 large subunit
MASALHDGIPILLIGGGGSTHFLGKAGMQEMFYKGHEDSVTVFRPVSKGAWMCVRPDTVVDTLNYAYNTAMSGKPGPVYVQLPLDIQMGEVEGDIEPPSARSVTRIQRAGVDEVAQAAKLVRDAEKPILLVGGGTARAHGAAEQIEALVDEHPMPVMTTLTAKGMLPETHELSLGPVGRSGTEAAARAAREADLVVAVGARFSDNHTSNWRKGKIYDVPRTKIIQLDLDPQEVGRNYPVELGLEGDASAFLQDLRSALGDAVDRSTWIKEVQGFRDEWEKEIKPIVGSTESPIHPGRLSYDVGEVIAEQGRVFIDIGDVIQYAEPYMTVHRPGSWHISPGMAEMGWAAQGAPGAIAADPDSPAVVLVGDGAFLMGPQVLATAIEYGMPIVWVILNNYELGIERKGAGAAFGRNHPWISFTTPDDQPYNPDFSALATSFGARGARIEKTEEFRPALEEAIDSGRPTVLDVLIDTSPPSYFTKGLDRAYPTEWAASYNSYGQLKLKSAD